MFKKLVVLAILALPVAAFASSIDVSNAGGTLAGTSSLSLTGSTLIKYGAIVGSNLGSVTFTTGTFTSGNAQMGGTLGAGGSFQIVGNGTNGVPNSVIFSGSFSSATWSLVTLSNGTHSYTLTAALVGANGTVGATTQLLFNTGTAFFSGSAALASGDTNLSAAVPEPGTLSLLGSGLIGVAGILRKRKSKT